MKGELKFDLDDREDLMAHMRCVKSLDMAFALFDIKQVLYKDDDEITVEEIKEIIGDVFSRYNINLDNLVE